MVSTRASRVRKSDVLKQCEAPSEHVKINSVGSPEGILIDNLIVNFSSITTYSVLLILIWKLDRLKIRVAGRVTGP